MKHPYITLPLGALLLLAACGTEQKTEDAAAEPPPSMTLELSEEELASYGVAFTAAEVREIQDVLTVPAEGILDQRRMGIASSLIDGRVRKVFADIGDAVGKGAPLAEIESMQLGELASTALDLHARTANLQAEFERLRELKKDDVASAKALQRAETEYRTTKAQYEGTLSQLRTGGLSNEEVEALIAGKDEFLPIVTLRAPIAGSIAERNAVAGQRVEAAQELFTIVDNSTVTVEGQVFQEDLSVLRTGMKAEFTTKAYPGERFTGSITAIGAALDAQTHTLPIRCAFANTSGKLRPYLIGELHIHTGGKDSTLSIPTAGLIYDGDDTYVFADEGSGSLRYTPVEVGRTFGKWIEVRSGLQPGTRIATEGVFMLKSEYKLSRMEEEE